MKLRDGEYRTLVEQAPMIIWRAGVDARCDYFNERWLDFTGRTLEQEVGEGWVEGVHPDDRQRCVTAYLRAFELRQSFEMEYRLRRHDGVYRWILDRGTPSHDSEGVFQGYIGSCIDVTERIEAAGTLRRQNELEMERLRKLVPVCFGCKSVRGDNGYWLAVDAYLHESGGQRVTHGLCPACSERLYPEA